MISGTNLSVKYSRGVDGDTIRVFLPDQDKDESLRILSLDTEESAAGGGKPVTPWGKKAKERAAEFFEGTENVTIEFPGNESFETCVQKYRGNYGRLLVWVYRNGVDFQETMIREGYSPYFMKYGHAEFADHHQRYGAAERVAQQKLIGVWDQTTVNGSEMRNYAALGTWWRLRARVIDDYRALRAIDPTLLNSRLDYAELTHKAENGDSATVFTEITSIRRVGGNSGLVGMASDHQPFNLFIPDIDSDEGQAIVQLMESRYISSGDTHPRRSYAFVTGALSTFNGRPQIVLQSVDQVSDAVVARADVDPVADVVIASLLPNPDGPDAGAERVGLRNAGASAAVLDGWKLRDRSGNEMTLTGSIDPGQERVIALEPGQLPLNNTGDDVILIDNNGAIRHSVTYSAGDVISGQTIQF